MVNFYHIWPTIRMKGREGRPLPTRERFVQNDGRGCSVEKKKTHCPPMYRHRRNSMCSATSLSTLPSPLVQQLRHLLTKPPSSTTTHGSENRHTCAYPPIPSPQLSALLFCCFFCPLNYKGVILVCGGFSLSHLAWGMKVYGPHPPQYTSKFPAQSWLTFPHFLHTQSACSLERCWQR